MPQPFVSGPGYIYAAVTSPPGGPAGPPAYLGVCESTPKIQFRPHFQGVFSDIAGPDIPHDWLYTGRDAMTFGDLTVYNWPILIKIMSRPNWTLASFMSDLAGSMGALMVTEGYTYNVWIQFPYASKPAFAGMPAGFRFANSWLFGPDEFDMGTKPNKIRIQMYHARALDILGNWSLGDNVMTALPAFPPISQAGI